jgi:hypothetical protein
VQNCNAARFHYARQRLAVCFRPPTDIKSLQAVPPKGAALGEGGIRPLAGVEETNKNQYLIGEKPQRRRGRKPQAPVGDIEKRRDQPAEIGAAFHQRAALFFVAASFHAAVQRNS